MKRAFVLVALAFITGCTAISHPALAPAKPAPTATAPAGKVPVWDAASWLVSTVHGPYGNGPLDGVAAANGALFWTQNGALYRMARGGDPAFLATMSGTNPSAGLVADGAGNLYVAGQNQVLRIDPTGAIAPWAGSGQAAFADGAGLEAGFLGIYGLCGDGQGTLYVTELGGRLRKIDPQGNVATVAGLTPMQRDTLFTIAPQGMPGFKENGPGYLTTLDSALGPCAVDGTGSVYFVEGGSVIRRLTADGAVVWAAGNPWYGGYADGSPAEAQFRRISALVADDSGNLWIADAGNQRIRRLATDGHVYTVAGGGLDGPVNKYGAIGQYTGAEVDGPGPDARLDGPAGLALADGRLYVAARSLRVIDGSSAPYAAGKAVAPIPGSGLVPAAAPVGQLPPLPVSVAYALYAPVRAISLTVDGKAVAETGPAFYTTTWDASDVPQGAHTMGTVAVLADGSRIPGAALQVTVVPTESGSMGIHYALLTPGYTGLVRGQVRFLVVGDGVDLELRIDGKTLAKGNGRLLTATWDTTSVPDGSHHVEIGHYIPEQGQMSYDQPLIAVVNGPLPSPQANPAPGLTVYLLGKPYTYQTGTPRAVDSMAMLPCMETLRYLQVEAHWDQAQRIITTRNGNQRRDTLDLATGAYTVADPRGSGSSVSNPKPLIENETVYCSFDFISDATELSGSFNPESRVVQIPSS